MVSVQSNALVTSFGRLFPFAEVWFVTLGGIGLEYFRRWVQSALEWGSGRDIARQKALLSSPKGPKKIINYRAVPLWLSFYCIIQFLVFFSFDPHQCLSGARWLGARNNGKGWAGDLASDGQDEIFEGLFQFTPVHFGVKFIHMIQHQLSDSIDSGSTD